MSPLNQDARRDPRLEAYLTELEQALRPMSVGDRAEIVTELKSHVLSALERDPEQPLDTVLAALGEPQTVANRYLLERGEKPVKPPISPIVKWLVIGFLGTLGMCLLFVGALAWKSLPLLDVTDRDHRSQVSLLGGLIHIDSEDGGPGGGSRQFEGSVPLPGTAGAGRVSVRFKDGTIDLKTAEGPLFTYSCRTHRVDAVPAPRSEGERVSFDLTELRGVKCEFSVPAGAALALDGANGKVSVTEPAFALDLSLANGKVGLEPREKQAYRYDLNIGNGHADSFESSSDAQALAIRVRLGNGKISRE